MIKRILLGVISSFVVHLACATSIKGIKSDDGATVFPLEDVVSIKASESDMMTVNLYGGESASGFSVLKFDGELNGLSSTMAGNAIKVYPNPVQRVLYLVGADENTDIVVVDMQGRIVLQGKGESIEVGSLKNGLYVIMAEGQKVKFIKE